MALLPLVAACSEDRSVRCDYECLAGWWYSDRGPCSVLCDISDPPPECEASDCRGFSVRRYEEDGTLQFLGVIYYSEERQSFSQRTPPRERSWEIAGECEFASSSGSMPFECDDETLKVPGALLYRPDASLEGAFEAALLEGDDCRHSF